MRVRGRFHLTYEVCTQSGRANTCVIDLADVRVVWDVADVCSDGRSGVEFVIADVHADSQPIAVCVRNRADLDRVLNAARAGRCPQCGASDEHARDCPASSGVLDL